MSTRQKVLLEVTIPASCPRGKARQYLKFSLENFTRNFTTYSFNVRAPKDKMIFRGMPGYLDRRAKP